MNFQEIMVAESVERTAKVPDVLPQLFDPELGVDVLVRAEVDEVRVDKVRPVDDGDGLVLQVPGAHVDDLSDFLVTGNTGLISGSDVANLEEIDQADLLFLDIDVVEKKTVRIHLQGDGHPCRVLET